MHVGSYLELNTTLFGWWVFDILWQIIIASGLVYIPIVAMVFRNWKEPSISQDVKPPSITSIKRMFWDVGTFVFVIMFFAMPTLNMEPEILNFQAPPSLGEPDPELTTPEESPYRDFGPDGGDGPSTAEVQVPVMYMLAMELTSGLNRAFAVSLPTIDDIRSAENFMNSAFISDPNLRSEMHRFTNECWAPARSRYFDNKMGMLDEFALTPEEQDQLEWIGGAIYVETDGLYGRCNGLDDCPFGDGFRAQTHVAAFGENGRDPDTGEYEALPYCDDWWTTANVGLRIRIFEHAQENESWIDRMTNWFTDLFGADGAQDRAIRSFIEGARANTEISPSELAHANNFFRANGESVGSTSGSTADHNILNGFKTFMTYWAIQSQGIETSGVAFVANLAAPMIQAVLLMVIYAMLPIFLLLSEYKLDKAVFSFLAIAAIKFFTALWTFAWWVDQNLIYSMYPDPYAMWKVWSGGGAGSRRILLDMITSGLYIGLPIIFLMMMTWAGFKVAQGIGAVASSMGAGAAAAGAKGGRSMNQELNKTASRAGSVAKAGADSAVRSVRTSLSKKPI